MKKTVKPDYQPQWHLEFIDFQSKAHERNVYLEMTEQDHALIRKKYLQHLIKEAEYTLLWFGIDSKKWKKIEVYLTPIGVEFNAHPKILINPMLSGEKKSLRHLKFIPFQVASIAAAANYIQKNSEKKHIELVWLKIGELKERFVSAKEYPVLYSKRQSTNAKKNRPLTLKQIILPLLVRLKRQNETRKTLIFWFEQNLNKNTVEGIHVLEVSGADGVKFLYKEKTYYISSKTLFNVFSQIKD